MRAQFAAVLVAALVAAFAMPARAGSTADDLKELREEVQRLRDEVNTRHATNNASLKSSVDTMMDSKYGPDAQVTTRAGKLTMGGLVQVWYYSIQNDSRGVFDGVNGIVDNNQTQDNDSFRIRRAEISFEVAVHENVSAFIMIDPAQEATSFPQLAVSQRTLANVSPEFNLANGPVLGATTGNVAAVQQGGGLVPRLLQDALINFHDAIPHHDVTMGQMKPFINEENMGSNGELDFVERSYIGQSVSRDLGAVLHGSWWCNGKGGAYEGLGDTGRFQYWLASFDGAGNLHGTAGQSLNRADDNDSKDFVGTMLVRPIWDDCWGKLELGAAGGFGQHGESGLGLQATNPVPGLDRKRTWSTRYDGWMKYYAPGILKGMWLKGEYLSNRDRNAPGTVIDVAVPDYQLGDGAGLANQAGPFRTYGYWGAIGYRLGESSLFCEGKGSFFKNFELDFRYESAPNIFIAKPTDPYRTNVYNSKIYTPGINYYIKGHNAKIQANYNFVQSPEGSDDFPLHHTRSDSFVLNFQVMW